MPPYTIVVAAGAFLASVIGGLLTYRASRDKNRGDRTDRYIDQLQEDLRGVREREAGVGDERTRWMKDNADLRELYRQCLDRNDDLSTAKRELEAKLAASSPPSPGGSP